MIIKEVTQVGNKVIRSKAIAVSNILSKQTQKIVTDLVDSMRHHALVGMAAPQIGKGVRIFVTEIAATKFRKPEFKDIDALRIFINPKIISSSSVRDKGWEGCGSVAFSNLFGKVSRPSSIVVEAFDREGTKFQVKATNLLARVIQHEIDHLNGVVFADTADTKTYMSKNEYLKMKKEKKVAVKRV